MAFPGTLTNITTADAYTDAATLEGIQPARWINIDVVNAAVIYQMKQAGLHNPNGVWGPEIFMVPAFRVLNHNDLCGIRVRSGITGIPAIVNIEAVR